MYWSNNRVTFYTEGVEDDVFYSPTFTNDNEDGPIVRVDVTPTNSDTFSVQAQKSIDNVNWVNVGSALTANGSVDHKSVRAQYWRWGVTNTTTNPSNPLKVELKVQARGGEGNLERTETQYSFGNTDILAELRTATTNVMFVGDSMSNNGATGDKPNNNGFNTFWHAALFAWKPVRWKGGYFAIDSSGVMCNESPETNHQAQDDHNALPGVILSNNNDGLLRGGHSTLATFIRRTGDPNNNQALALNVYPRNFKKDETRGNTIDYFQTGIEIFTNSDNTREIGTVNAPFRIAGEIFGVGTSTYDTILEARMYARVSGNNNQQLVENWVDQTVNAKSGYWMDLIGRTITLPDTFEDGFETNDSGGTTAQGATLQLRDKSETTGNRINYAATFVGTTGDGLTISYAGAGGFQIESHSQEMGDVTPYQVGGVLGQYGYTDEHIKARMELEGTDYLWINIGANNVDATNDTGAYMIAEAEKLVARFTRLRPGIKFIFTPVVRGVNTYQGSNNTERIAYNDGLKALCESRDDCVFVDLEKFSLALEPTFGSAGGNDDYVDRFLSGLRAQADSTHPSASGAFRWMSLFWSEVLKYSSR